MEQILTVLIVILGVVLLVTVIMIRNNKEREHFLENRIKNQWGKVPQREFSYEEFQSMSLFGKENETSGFFIDNITWNDLDMDRMFLLMNNTMSSCGEEYLYYMLRHPLFSKEELTKRERFIKYFQEYKEKAFQVQKKLGVLGKTRYRSVYEYLKVVQDYSHKTTSKHKIQALLGVASIGTIFLIPSAGILFFIIMLAYNFITYFKDKGDIAIYLKSFQIVLNMMETAKDLQEFEGEDFKPYIEKLKKANTNLASFKRGSFLVTKSGQSGGDIVELVLEYVKMFFHIDLIKFNGMLIELQKKEQDVRDLYETLGCLDSYIAIASFREYLPYYSIPNLKKDDKAFIEVVDLYHPLIENPVANTLKTKNSILVTGSNASGKSTFLKNLAINAILAQTIYTSVATSYEGCYLKVVTSMALQDNLESGESYYIVEIKSLNRILMEAKDKTPMLCIVDEVLRGTNTIERIAASSRILQSLAMPHVLSFAATHDIELSYILEKYYENYHFAEGFLDHEIVFNYLLRKGRCTTRNAIKLLEVIGYDNTIVREAKKAAQEFEREGTWGIIKKNS